MRARWGAEPGFPASLRGQRTVLYSPRPRPPPWGQKSSSRVQHPTSRRWAEAQKQGGVAGQGGLLPSAQAPDCTEGTTISRRAAPGTVRPAPAAPAHTRPGGGAGVTVLRGTRWSCPLRVRLRLQTLEEAQRTQEMLEHREGSSQQRGRQGGLQQSRQDQGRERKSGERQPEGSGLRSVCEA